ncbi:Protein shifted [Orchesella cincta]|uniref:Protein shifted n=1 Tax=Orchesella cincta TaxID=48709 RepID=A0A1D2N4A3_ORCCI|nr:Protein shifted [Orchesella cincta]
MISICSDKCLNGGKCVQKDTCECTSGYYGLRCEYSKCMIPCLNGGRCKGVNTCRCVNGYTGDHCEIGHSNRTLSQRHTCALPCRHGECVAPNKCECHQGWYGRRCQRSTYSKCPNILSRLFFK